MTLEELGWEQYKQTLDTDTTVDTNCVGRVVAEHKTNYAVITSAGERQGVLRGKALRYLDEYSKPKVGDWVVCANNEQVNADVVAIESILPRCSTLRRHAAGGGEGAQILVTNIDHVLIMQGLDDNFNLNRLERYLVMVENSGASPVVVLNKADLIDNKEEVLAQVHIVAPDTPLVMLSSTTRDGVGDLNEHLEPGTTSVFVGSSGVGKSTLLNVLLGSEVQHTQGLRDDDQGRHTTTHRELFLLPNKAIVIDTPGMRELSLEGLETLGDTFADIEERVGQCKFRDCDHEYSHGCAVQAAVAAGEFDAKRVGNYMKLQKEIAYEASQVDEKRKRERKEQVQTLRRQYRKISRAKYKEQGYK